ncbi:MAG TPA: ankyrin repeat domain-containing protein [Spirochaetota bacterium]|nr:ankyrin repeat domain-containing protein [Spirochaetota bacterium]
MRKIIFMLIIPIVFCSSCNIHCSDYEYKQENITIVSILAEAEKNNAQKIYDLYYEGMKDLNVNEQRKKDLKTPLHLALEYNNIKLVQFLLKRGANEFIKDGKGITPLDYALNHRQYSIVEMFAKEHNWESLDYFKSEGSFEKLIISKYTGDPGCRKALQHILDVWLQKEFGGGLMLNDNPNYEKIEYLMSVGADINGMGRHFDRWTGLHPLYLAVDNNNLEITKYLVARGAWVNIHFDDEPGDTLGGETPLMSAISGKNNEIAKYLIQHGADMNVEVGGHTPLSFAIDYHNREMKTLLQSVGAKMPKR